jgi:hypothetical protein
MPTIPSSPNLISLAWPRNPLTNVLDSNYYTPDPDITWNVAPEYQYETTPFQMEMVTLKRNSGPDAYHKFASANWEYRAYVGWRGGKPPFRVTLLEAPSGATIGSSGLVQTMTRTPDASVNGVLNHGIPEEANTIKWVPQLSDVGLTRKFKVQIEDSVGQQIVNTHYVTVDENKFIYADVNAVDDTGAGTWTNPKKTFAAAHNNAGKICIYKAAGVYNVTFGGLSNYENRSRNHIAIVPGVVFDMSTEQFGVAGPGSDLAFIGIEFNGCVATNSHVRVFNNGGKTDRALWWGCKWRNVSIGAVGNDNPGCITLMSLGSPSGTPRDLPSTHLHEDIAVVQCDVDDTVDIQQITMFGTNRTLFEFNTASYKPTVTLSVAGHNNGATWLHHKDGNSKATARFNICNSGGFTLGPIIFSNQRGWFCNEQEMLFNFIRCSQGSLTSFSRQHLVKGNVQAGQRVGPENTRCIRNTFIATGSGQVEFLRWDGPTGLEEPTIFENNIVVTTASNIHSSQALPHNAFTNVGVNQKLALSDVNAQHRLTGNARNTHLGKQGAEIASIEVVQNA